jgi:hypothetical protein
MMAAAIYPSNDVTTREGLRIMALSERSALMDVMMCVAKVRRIGAQFLYLHLWMNEKGHEITGNTMGQHY